MSSAFLRVLTAAVTTLTAAAVAVTAAPLAAGSTVPTQHGSVRTTNFETADTWLYGDSITVDDGTDLSRRLAAAHGWEVAIDALGGRRTAPTVDVMLADLAAFGAPERIVLAIGTNNTLNTPAVQEARLDVARVLAAAPASTQVAWVTPFADPTSRPADVRAFYVRNSGWVADAILASGYTVCDWHGYLSQPDQTAASHLALLRDGMHTSSSGDPNGRDVRNALISTCLDHLGEPGPQPRFQPSVPPAPPVGECRVLPPARVALAAPVRDVGVGFDARCASTLVRTAAWDVVGSRGTTAKVTFAGTGTRGAWVVRGTQVPGRATFRPTGARDQAGRPATQNTVTSDVRYSSRSTVELRRTGTSVQFLVKARRWAPATNTYVAWTSMPATLQYRSGDRWVNFRAPVKTDAAGNASVTLTVPATHEYRVVVADLGSTWGATSSTARG